MALLEPSAVDCVIYHADCTDGFGSAYSAWKLLGNRAEYHACKHGTLPPDVKGKNVVLVDDMVDTAGTLTKAADLMMERGALSVRAICTHPIMSGSAFERLENSKLQELIVTDSIPLGQESPKLKVLTCATLFADVMKSVHENESISSKFLM